MHFQNYVFLVCLIEHYASLILHFVIFCGILPFACQIKSHAVSCARENVVCIENVSLNFEVTKRSNAFFRKKRKKYREKVFRFHDVRMKFNFYQGEKIARRLDFKYLLHYCIKKCATRYFRNLVTVRLK